MALLRKFLPPKWAYFGEHIFPEKRKHRSRMIEHYRQFINPGDLVFDVGANLGERTKVFRELGAKVIAIEPTSCCVNYLQHLFVGDDNVIVVGYALGEQEGTGEIRVSEKLPVLSTMSPKWVTESRFSKNYHWEKTEKIKITTMDKLIVQYGSPAFCKVDVEGFELEVFRGLSSKIPMISFEFLYEFLDDSMKCIDTLASIGTMELNFNIGEDMEFFSKSWIGKEEIRSEIMKMGNEKLWGDIYVRMR